MLQIEKLKTVQLKISIFDLVFFNILRIWYIFITFLCMKKYDTKAAFGKHIISIQKLNPNWCKEVLLIRSKIRDLSQATADTERMFIMMNRINGKLSSRICKSLGHRMRVQAHVPRNPELIDWEYAYNLWKEKRRDTT